MSLEDACFDRKNSSKNPKESEGANIGRTKGTRRFKSERYHIFQEREDNAANGGDRPEVKIIPGKSNS